jgi:hemerythrin superfamily protein
MAAGFACGLLSGIVASRILPPIAAMACGAMRSTAGRDPLASLVTDHRHFRSLLTAMEKASDGSVVQRGQLLLRLKRRLAAHSMAEENVVYPMLREFGAAAPEADHLYEEHAEIKILLFKLEQQALRGEPWTDDARKLRELIGGHAEHEESVDFPRLRDALSETQQRTLASKVEREKAMIL